MAIAPEPVSATRASRASRSPSGGPETKHGPLPAINLFSGVGGLDLGVSRAGFDIRAAVESEHNTAASLRANHFRDRPEAVLERSIVGVSTDEILECTGLRVGQAALFGEAT